jgi:hypothetical protein
METKMKNFRLPLDLCDALEKDKRKQIDVVKAALTKELGLDKPEPVVVPKNDFDARVAELSKTLPAATATRIALLEMT